MNAKWTSTPFEAHQLTPIARTLGGSAPPTDLDGRNHAIKNCAAVILGLASSMDRYVDPVGRQRVAQLVEAARRMATLVAPTATQSQPKAENVPVEEVLRLAVRRLEPVAESRCVQVDVDCAGGSVVGDLAELAEAVFNLASNAIQASPPNGTVRVVTRHGRAGEHEWTVEDAGCGIPASVLPRLGRVGVTTRRGGSGLGLALAAQTISRHQGTLRVESQGTSGAGTTAIIRLPAAG